MVWEKSAGTLDLLEQGWENIQGSDHEGVISYLVNLMNTLRGSLELVAAGLQRQQVKQGLWCDRKVRERCFGPGDEVLVLGPLKGSKLQLDWAGPFSIVSEMNH